MSKFAPIETIYCVANNPDFINHTLNRRETVLKKKALTEGGKVACRMIDSPQPFEVVTMEELLLRVDNLGPHVFYKVGEEIEAMNALFGWTNEDHYEYICNTYLY